MTDDMLNLSEAARYLNVTPLTLQKQIKAGNLPVHHDPEDATRQLIKRSDLELLRNSLTPPTPAAKPQVFQTTEPDKTPVVPPLPLARPHDPAKAIKPPRPAPAGSPVIRPLRANSPEKPEQSSQDREKGPGRGQPPGKV